MTSRQLNRRDMLATLVAAGLPSAVFAHRAHVSLTRITLNKRAQTWEIEHELHHHDAEQALRRQPGASKLQLTSVEGRARVALYVEQRFALMRPNGAGLALRTAGADFEHNTLLVFQECAAPAEQGRFRVRNTILQDVFPEQTNRVLIALAGTPHALALSAGQPEGEFAVLS